MKNFHLFAGSQYYPNAGLRDYIGSFIDCEDAARNIPRNCDWWYIITTNDSGGLIVAKENM